MQTISAGLQAIYAGETVAVCKCLKITWQSGVVFGFTSLDSDLTIAGTTYQTARGISHQDVTTSNSMDVDTTEVRGMLIADCITDDDLRAGLWDFAEFELFEVNYLDLTQGTRRLRMGNVGEVKTDRGGFVAELLGLMQAYQTILVELSSPGCRAQLGDIRCKVDLYLFTFVGAVTGVIDALTVADTSRSEADNYFAYGVIEFTSGLNLGIAREVKSFANAGGVVGLQVPFPYEVEVGDAYFIIAGCDKKRTTCIVKFDNIVNMRAEPHLAGRDALMQVGRHNP